MNTIALISAACIGAVLSLLLKQYRPEYSLFTSLGTGILLLVAVISALGPVLEEINDIAQTAQIDGIYIKILMKSLAVCYITQLAYDCCKDAGESAIAGKIDMAGKISVLIISLPLFTAITDLIKKLISA